MRFNNDVNKEDIEKHFSLAGETRKIDGKFDWATGSEFTFVPRLPLSVAQRYTIEIPRSVRDCKGNTMEYDFLSDFYVGNDFVSPVVISSIPAYTEGGAANVPVDQNIVINFSKTMNIPKTESSFTISPHVAGRFVWGTGPSEYADSQMTYQLTTHMDYGIQYKFTLSTSATDISDNNLATSYSNIFITGYDFQPPSVTGINDSGITPFWNTNGANPNINKNVSIYVLFSEPMNRASCESAFSLTPTVSGHFTWNTDTMMIFHPAKDLATESVYQIRVDTTAKDQNGLKLSDLHQVTVQTMGSTSLHVKIGAVYGSYDDGDTDPYRLLFTGKPDPLTWPVTITMGPWPNQKYYFKIQFVNNASPSAPVPMNKYSILENHTLISFNRDEGFQGIIEDVAWIDDSTAKLKVAGLSNTLKPMPPVLYRLTLHGGAYGVKDVFGNTMVENFVFEFRE